jgi:hypothetical protein
MAEKVSATCVVTFTVEVPVGPWGGDARFDDLREQAKREAEDKLRALLSGRARIVSVDKYGAVIVKDDT